MLLLLAPLAETEITESYQTEGVCCTEYAVCMGTVSKKCMGSKKGELECGVAEANMGHVRVPVYAGQGLKLLPGAV